MYDKSKSTNVAESCFAEQFNVAYPVIYKQETDSRCAIYGLLSALYHTKHRDKCDKLMAEYREKEKVLVKKYSSDICSVICSALNAVLGLASLNRQKKAQLQSFLQQKNLEEVVCLLVPWDSHGVDIHAVGIAHGHIFDASQPYAIPLTEDNLKLCCDKSKSVEIKRLYVLKENVQDAKITEKQSSTEG